MTMSKKTYMAYFQVDDVRAVAFPIEAYNETDALETAKREHPLHVYVEEVKKKKVVESNF